MSLTSETRSPLRHADKFFIGGEWVAPSSADLIDVIDSSTEKLYFQISEARAADMDRAVTAARTAFDEGPWPRLTHAERAEYMRAFGKELASRGDVLGDIWPRESGVLASVAGFVSVGSASVFDYYADMANTYAFEEPAQPSLG